MANTESIYRGGVFSSDPLYKISPYGSTGYKTEFSKLGSAIDPFVANQLGEVLQHLNSGVKNIEIGTIKPESFGAIPKQHFAEIRRAAKLAGAEVSFHAPMIDPTGIGEHGWNKLSQQMAENQLWDAVKKSQELNPNGTVVTIHATAGYPGASETKVFDEKTGKEKVVALTVVDRATGKIGQIGEKEKYFGAKGEGPIEFNVQDEMEKLNEEVWSGTINNLNFAAERGRQQLDAISESSLIQNNPFFTGDKQALKELEKDKENPQYKRFKETYEKSIPSLRHTKLFLREAYQNTKSLYDEVYKNASPENKAELKAYADKIIPMLKDFDSLEHHPEKMKEFADAIENGVEVISKIKPVIYEPIKDFAVEKSAETTANLALKAYNEFEKQGKNAPIIALENHPSQQALLTSGEELRAVVDKSRELFISKAVQEGLSKDEAKKAAEKLIGATWDVGHINQLRMFGYGKEKVIEESAKIAPVVKKVHLSDNFGLQNTELPMGMGNVPLAEIMNKLGKEGFEAKKIIEAGNWWAEFSRGTKANNPLIPTLAAMGSPIYSGGYSGSQVGWNQVYGIPGGYFAGYGTMLPEQHFSIYGAGFMPLPMELGGQTAKTDRSGVPID